MINDGRTMNARYVICQLIRLFFFHVSESNGIGRMRNVSCASVQRKWRWTDRQIDRWTDRQTRMGRFASGGRQMGRQMGKEANKTSASIATEAVCCNWVCSGAKNGNGAGCFRSSSNHQRNGYRTDGFFLWPTSVTQLSSLATAPTMMIQQTARTPLPSREWPSAGSPTKISPPGPSFSAPTPVGRTGIQSPPKTSSIPTSVS